MTNEESDEHIESTASGLEPISLDATEALAHAEQRAKAEAAGTEPPHVPLSKRVTQEWRKLLGR